MTLSRVLRVLLILGLFALLLPITLAQAQGGSGTAVIHDGSTLSDTATIKMTGVPSLAEGKLYEGWFVSDDESRKASAGILGLEPGGDINHSFFLAEPGPPRPALTGALAAARAATAKYRDVQRALADGYLATDDCVSVPGLGTMGFHYVNPGLIADPGLDPAVPEVLLYVESGAGLRLVSVEYLLTIGPSGSALGDASVVDPGAPTLFGQTFDGPTDSEIGDPVQGHTLFPHYDLHAWLFAENPAGTFVGFNSDPSLTCDPTPTGENLFADFDKFVVTVEPADDSDPAPSTEKAFFHKIPAGGIKHIRHLAFSLGGNPAYTSGPHEGLPKGIVVGLREETAGALKHARLAAAAGDLAGVQLHACHVVNYLEGYETTDCPGFGDGFGVVNYASDAAAHAALAQVAAPNDAKIAEFAPVVMDNADAVSNAQGTGAADRALAQAVLAQESDDPLTARLYINNTVDLLRNDAEAHQGALHSASHAYVGAQEMGTYTIVELPSVGEPLVPQIARGILIGGIVLVLAGLALLVRMRPRPARS